MLLTRASPDSYTCHMRLANDETIASNHSSGIKRTSPTMSPVEINGQPYYLIIGWYGSRFASHRAPNADNACGTDAYRRATLKQGLRISFFFCNSAVYALLMSALLVGQAHCMPGTRLSNRLAWYRLHDGRANAGGDEIGRYVRVSLNFIV